MPVVSSRGARLCRLALAGAALALLAAPAVEAEPKLVASVPPLHSLAAAVMDGVGMPVLLVPGGRSAHDYALRPSDARALAEADIILWVGRPLETWLDRPLRTLGDKATVLTLADSGGLIRLPPRRSGVWADEHGHDHAPEGAGGAASAIDGHLWLSAHNAQAIGEATAAALAARDPPNAARYRANARALAQRIAALRAALDGMLAPVRDRPYVVFHDAYQYFEREFDLHPVGAIAISPERAPGARRLAAVRRAIAERGARCVFSEPQFAPALAESMARGTPARAGVLDPLGAGLTPGPDLWFALMRGLARALRDCLAADSNGTR